MTDIVTIGSATVDVFVKCEDANIVSVSSKTRKSEFMSYPYGAKMDIADFASNIGGGGVNTAINFANLGFSTMAIFKIGDDIYSRGILEGLEDKNVDLSYIIQDKKSSTGFSIILVSFQGERTVLARRGANAQIKKSEINFEAIKGAKFIYIAPLNGESNKVLEPIVDFAIKNNIKIGYNAGTTCIRRGFKYLKRILEEASIVVMNKEEAMMSTNIAVRPDSSTNSFSDEIIHLDIKEMLECLKVRDHQIVVITDGGNGAYAYDGKDYFYCPIFDGKIESTLGAGDAFASTFCAAINYTNIDICKSLMIASVNATAVVSKFGATEGLLTLEEIEERLSSNVNYSCVKI